MKLRLLKLAAVAMALCFATPALASENDRPLLDSRGQPVRVISNDSCVLTYWTGPVDQCGGDIFAGMDLSVYFDFDSARLTQAAQTKLVKIADMLKSDTTIRKVTIVGFADRIGSSSYNLALSTKRAKAVQGFLGKLGTKSDLAIVSGAGVSKKAECQGLKGDALKACLAPDRRVDVRLEKLN